jgi:Tfp pilus assembly protein PilF
MGALPSIKRALSMKRLLSASLYFLLLSGGYAVSAEPLLDKLRRDYAMRYVEPEPHMALARHYYDKGNRLQSFLVLEHARRQLFPADQFDAAFEQTFLKREPFDNSKGAEATLLTQHGKDPTSLAVVEKLADIYISRDDWPRAKEYLSKAMQLKPDKFLSVGALAEVLRRERKPERAAKVTQEFMDKYPESKEAYETKIALLMAKDPEEKNPFNAKTKEPKPAKKLLVEAIKKFPAEGFFLFNMGVLLQEEGNLKEAEDHFVKAASLASQAPHIQGWTARFFLKVKDNEAKALEYYLNAYLLDPHFYDTEYAEQRITDLGQKAAQRRFKTLIKEGKKLEDVVRDSAPMIAGLGLDEIANKWDARYAKVCFEALGHDDTLVRSKARHVLMAHVDRSFDPDVRALLQDPDLRKRAAAISLAIKLWGKKGVEEVRPWLKADAQILRYYALLVLYQDGGEEGRKLVRERRKEEQHPYLKKIIESVNKE